MFGPKIFVFSLNYPFKYSQLGTVLMQFQRVKKMIITTYIAVGKIIDIAFTRRLCITLMVSTNQPFH